jgi:hypothetical protein
MKMNRASIIAVVIACAPLAVLAQQASSSLVKATIVQPSFKVFQVSDLLSVDDEEAVIKKELTPTINELISKRNYTELDKMADNLRKSKAQVANGAWHLWFFYEILSDLPCTATDTDWKARIDFFNGWINAKPDSITSTVALAECYASYAWCARGGGYADSVTEVGWKLYKERFQQAKQTLTRSKQLKQECPFWWVCMQQVALAEGWELASYNKLFDDAISHEPGNITIYRNKVNYLLPRWFGNEGDWQKFALEVTDKIGGEAGDILYARIGWRVHENHIYGGFLRDSGYSWPRMKKGLEAIIKQRPHSLTAASELAYLAYQAKDRACAKPLFERIGTNVDNTVWSNDKARFLRARTWALWE